jgi:hypothetical protein
VVVVSVGTVVVVSMLSPLVHAAATSAVASTRETRRILTMASQVTGGNGVNRFGIGISRLPAQPQIAPSASMSSANFLERVESKPEH